MVYFGVLSVYFGAFWCLLIYFGVFRSERLNIWICKKISLYATRMPPTQFIFSGEIRSATKLSRRPFVASTGCRTLGTQGWGGTPGGPKGTQGRLRRPWVGVVVGTPEPSAPPEIFPQVGLAPKMSPGRGFYPRTPSSPRNLPPSWVGAQNVPWKRGGFTPEPPSSPPKSSPKLGWRPKCPLEEGGAGGSGVKPPSRGHFGRQPNLGEDFGGS